MQFMANIREFFIQTNSVQVIFTCNFSQRQSKNQFCLEPFLSSMPSNGKYISCCKIFEYVLLSIAVFFFPNRRNSFVQRFRDWSCFNCLGELANNCSFCIEEETTQEKFVSGCKYGVCRCHVRSCVPSLFCLLGRRSSISIMKYIQWLYSPYVSATLVFGESFKREMSLFPRKTELSKTNAWLKHYCSFPPAPCSNGFLLLLYTI